MVLFLKLMKQLLLCLHASDSVPAVIAAAAEDATAAAGAAFLLFLVYFRA